MSYFIGSFTNILQNGINTTNDTAQAWDQTWTNLFAGGNISGATIFGSMVQLGELFAVVAVIIAGLLTFKDMNNHKAPQFNIVIWPLIAMTMFAADGALLAQTVLGLRGIINQISDQVATSVVAGVQLDEALKNLGGQVMLQQTVEDAYRGCLSMTGAARADCLQEAADYGNELANSFGNVFGAAQWIGDIINSFRNASNAVQNGTGGALIGLFSPIWEPILYAILFALMKAYQNMLEAVMILIGLTAPLALGGSLIGFGTPAFIGWLSGFFSFGLAKIFFNLLIGLAASVATNAGLNDPAWFALFVGICAPIISFAMASGSGFVIWGAMTSMAASATTGATSMITKKA